uniref:Uncharacterized protein n=1 Tax=Hyaloperonospora arabidopsidis (strain Emoy2) TaxID=559515 RepID=M4BNV9_HYAAE
MDARRATSLVIVCENRSLPAWSESPLELQLRPRLGLRLLDRDLARRRLPALRLRLRRSKRPRRRSFGLRLRRREDRWREDLCFFLSSSLSSSSSLEESWTMNKTHNKAKQRKSTITRAS